MKDYLNRYLNKLGVKSYEELNQEEKKTYREWEKALSGRSIADPDYRTFLESELRLAVLRLTDVDLPIESAAFRKAEVKILQKIILLLDSPKVEKELLEKQIENMV